MKSKSTAYQQVLKYLLDQLPMFQKVGASAYRNDLGNIVKLCNILGNPQKELKLIHVAGTNGKGSVTHVIASILQEQGYKTGVFVSPHYKDFRERIKINGKKVSKNFLTAFVQKNIKKFKKIDASFFEISTAMAFEYFKNQQVDYAVIETGMGGRLDSTNIIEPLLSVITNISFDHQQFLGNTLPLIAAEKAGIIKNKVPVIIGETNKETKPVFIKKAKEYSSPIYFADKEIGQHNFMTDLRGEYQQKNITTSLMAIKVLRKTGVKISDKAIKNGLKNVAHNTSFIGRWTLRGKKPLTIFDSAHNEGGLRALKHEIDKTPFKKLHFVYGTVGDKDISKNLAVLPKNAHYYFCKADIPRALEAVELKRQAEKFSLQGDSYASVKKAFKAAKKAAGAKDMILVAGSIFVVAEVL